MPSVYFITLLSSLKYIKMPFHGRARGRALVKSQEKSKIQAIVKGDLVVVSCIFFLSPLMSTSFILVL